MQHLVGSPSSSSPSPAVRQHPRTSAMQIKLYFTGTDEHSLLLVLLTLTQPSPAPRHSLLSREPQLGFVTPMLCRLEGWHSSSGTNVHTGVQVHSSRAGVTHCHCCHQQLPHRAVQGWVRGLHTDCSASFPQITLKVVCHL